MYVFLVAVRVLKPLNPVAEPVKWLLWANNTENSCLRAVPEASYTKKLQMQICIIGDEYHRAFVIGKCKRQFVCFPC